jgi:hypothetical protein
MKVVAATLYYALGAQGNTARWGVCGRVRLSMHLPPVNNLSDLDL